MVKRWQQSIVKADTERWVGGASWGNDRSALRVAVFGSFTSSASRLLLMFPLLPLLLLDEPRSFLALMLFIDIHCASRRNQTSLTRPRVKSWSPVKPEPAVLPSTWNRERIFR